MTLVIIVGVAAKDPRLTVCGLMSFAIVGCIASEDTGIAMTNFMPFGIIVGVSAEDTGLTPANLMTIVIIVGVASKNVRYALAFVCHSFTSISAYHIGKTNQRISENVIYWFVVYKKFFRFAD